MENLKALGFKDVDINGGFWKQKQDLIAETSIYSVQKRFKETGRFDAFKCDWEEGMPNRPHIFWDSDIAKWMEAVAYLIQKKPNAELENEVEELIDNIEKNQDKNGYFNIYYLLFEPENKFTNRDNHELYCAGHLIEAAIAYKQATGKDRFLKLMCRYADYIERRFFIERNTSYTTPGHEEIELALIKLYHETGEKRYLNLSRFFLDMRANNPERRHPNTQDDCPVREITEAKGHSVRAVYLYSAMADMAAELDDKELFDACRRVFDNIVKRRMYITGGIGASSHGETFSIDYDLPNIYAYAESCAAIGLAFFAKRMQVLEADSVYADIVERVLYNGFLSSISLDGKSYFYENPLEFDARLLNRPAVKQGHQHMPIIKRLEVFGCSCCPPNITRFVSSLGDYLYTYFDNEVYLHQFISSQSNINGVTVKQTTNYPSDGYIKIETASEKDFVLNIRIPYWCRSYKIKLNDTEFFPPVVKGYAKINLKSEKNEVEVNFEMPVELMESRPEVQENSGRAAVQRGPVIYCAESCENGENLRDLVIKTPIKPLLEYSDYFSAHTITLAGKRRKKESFSDCYRPLKSEYTDVEIKLIPYYAFANRDSSEMIVWLRVCE